MTQATRLDRANWAQIQYGNGAPSANTKGKICKISEGDIYWLY